MDWSAALSGPPRGVIFSMGDTLIGDYQRCVGNTYAVAAWPAANRGIYIPFTVDSIVTAYKMAWENGATLNGTVDVGIYDAAGKRLVSWTAQNQAGASTIQIADITDTVLDPGCYYMAISSSSATGTFGRWASNLLPIRASGIQQQASVATLPDPATFAVAASAFVPALAIALKATI